jgi:hypothetical protein
VLQADPFRAVQECVDQREANDVRFGAWRGGAGEAGLAGRQLRVEGDPPLARGVIERERAFCAGEAECEPNRLAEIGELCVVDRAAERQQLGPVDGRPRAEVGPVPNAARTSTGVIDMIPTTYSRPVGVSWRSTDVSVAALERADRVAEPTAQRARSRTRSARAPPRSP